MTWILRAIHTLQRQNISLMFVAFQPECLFHSYPEIADAKFGCALWTFEQQLALKMRALVEFPLFSYKRFCTVTFGIRPWMWLSYNYPNFVYVIVFVFHQITKYD